MSDKIATTPTYTYNSALTHLERAIQVPEIGHPIKG